MMYDDSSSMNEWMMMNTVSWYMYMMYDVFMSHVSDMRHETWDMRHEYCEYWDMRHETWDMNTVSWYMYMIYDDSSSMNEW